MSRTKLILATDGAAPNNQSRERREASIGYLIQQEGKTALERSEYLGQGPKYTNNFAEYRAIIEGVSEIEELYDPAEAELVIETDSQLVVEQVSGSWSVNNANLRTLHSELLTMLDEFDEWRMNHVSESTGNRIERVDALASRAAE